MNIKEQLEKDLIEWLPLFKWTVAQEQDRYGIAGTVFIIRGVIWINDIEFNIEIAIYEEQYVKANIKNMVIGRVAGAIAGLLANYKTG